MRETAKRSGCAALLARDHNKNVNYFKYLCHVSISVIVVIFRVNSLSHRATAVDLTIVDVGFIDRLESLSWFRFRCKLLLYFHNSLIIIYSDVLKFNPLFHFSFNFFKHRFSFLQRKRLVYINESFRCLNDWKPVFGDYVSSLAIKLHDVWVTPACQSRRRLCSCCRNGRSSCRHQQQHQAASCPLLSACCAAVFSGMQSRFCSDAHITYGRGLPDCRSSDCV